MNGMDDSTTIVTKEDAEFALAALFEWADKGLRRGALIGINREAAELVLELDRWRHSG